MSKAAPISSTASTLPATTTGPAPPAVASACAFAEQDLGVATVGAPDQQDDVGLGARSAAQVDRVVGHVHDTTSARQRDPTAGLGGDELLVADDGDPQSPPAEEQASTGTSAPSVDGAISARIASQPSSTSVSMVVRWLPVAISAPVSTSTSAALVNVEPKSTQ